MPIVRKDTAPFPCRQCGGMIRATAKRYGKTGKLTWIMPTAYCSFACSAIARGDKRRGRPNAARGRGQGWVDTAGYVRFSDPERRGIIHEHRRVMERELGRKLRRGETVHHKDGNRQNNAPSNLELWASGHPAGQRVSDFVWPGMASAMLSFGV